MNRILHGLREIPNTWWLALIAANATLSWRRLWAAAKRQTLDMPGMHRTAAPEPQIKAVKDQG